MRKVLKKSLAILLSLMMTVSVVSAAAIVSADTDYTMTAIVAMKPQDGDELLATRHIFNLTEEQLTALNGGNAVDLATTALKPNGASVLPPRRFTPNISPETGIKTIGDLIPTEIFIMKQDFPCRRSYPRRGICRRFKRRAQRHTSRVFRNNPAGRCCA